MAVTATKTNIYATALALASSQYWSIADGSQTGLDITGNMTISCWVNFDSLPSAGNNYTMVSKYTNASRSYFLALNNNAGTYRLMFLAGNGGGTSTNKTVDWTPSTGTWYQVAVVYTAAGGTADFYVNGSQQGTQQSGLPTSMGNGTAAFAIGALADPADYYDGKIDDVRIWARALTSGQVAALIGGDSSSYNGANLVGWWKFENVATDASGNSNTLTGTNTPTYVTPGAYPGDLTISGEIIGASVEGAAGVTSEMVIFAPSLSEVAGTPVDTVARAGFGWVNQDKSSAGTITNQDKS